MPFYDSSVTHHRTFRPLLAILCTLALVLSACGSTEQATTDTSAVAPAAQAGSADDMTAESTPTTAATGDTATTGDTTAESAPATSVATGDTTTAGDTKRTRLGDKLTVADQATQSGRFEALISIAGDPEFPEGVEFSMEGAFSGESSEVSLDFGTLAAAAMTSEGAGDLGPFAAMFEEPLIVRTIGTQAYISWPILAMFSGGQGTWIEAEADDASSVTEGFGAGGIASPSDFVASLEDANAEVTELGTEEIRGVETTHFRALVDLAELSSTMSPEERASLEDDFGDIDTSEFPIEFWVDADGLLRRYSMNIAEETGASASFVFDLFDYGADISIEAPPADEIIPADQLDLDAFGF